MPRSLLTDEHARQEILGRVEGDDRSFVYVAGRPTGPSPSSAAAHDLRAAVDSALDPGRHGERTNFEVVRLRRGEHTVRPGLSSFPEADARFLRGELLREQGRLHEALRWYGSFPDPGAYDLIYLAPSHLRRAEVYEQLGDSLAAARHYTRVLEIWKDADPAFRPWIEAAMAGIARLSSEPG